MAVIGHVRSLRSIRYRLTDEPCAKAFLFKRLQA